MSWEDAWKEGKTGWDTGKPAPSLVDLLQSNQLPTQGRALVPGCGAGYDAMALASHGLNVTGLDISPTAADRYAAVRAEAGLSEAQASIYIGDFFAFEPPKPFDVVWDYTFLCAIDLEMREAWAQKMKALLADGGELVTLIFPIVRITQDRLGPPFQLLPEDVRALLEPLGFEAVHLKPLHHTLSHKSRRGKEWLGRWRLR